MKNKSVVRLFFAGVATVLAVAATLQALPPRESSDAVQLPPLTTLLPASVPGWTVRDQKLGETEVDERYVRDVLKYDDAILRTYTRGSTSVGVFMAYWRPENSTPGKHRAHSPDSCFPAGGWRSTQKDQIALERATWSSLPGQFRIYSRNGETVELLFWHLSCRRLSGKMLLASAGWGAIRHDFWELARAFPFRTLQDEIFVRISSNGPIQNVVDSDLFAQLKPALACTGALRLAR